MKVGKGEKSSWLRMDSPASSAIFAHTGRINPNESEQSYQSYFTVQQILRSAILNPSIRCPMYGVPNDAA